MSNQTNKFKILTILIPAFNESNTIESVIKKVKASDTGHLLKEIIVIDNKSTDATKSKALAFPDIKVIDEHTQGKGAALKAGLCRTRIWNTILPNIKYCLSRFLKIRRMLFTVRV